MRDSDITEIMSQLAKATCNFNLPGSDRRVILIRHMLLDGDFDQFMH